MKINFKKLAITAGVTAAMAAGSMSAQAVITAVPAPAQLVPLFYFNNGQVITGSPDLANVWDTEVRITVPKAVGTDSVILLLSGQRNGIDNIPVSTNWDVTSAAFKETVIGGNTNAINQIHWYWLNNRSEEMNNGTITVTPDDTVWLSAKAMADKGDVRSYCKKIKNPIGELQCLQTNNVAGKPLSGQPGYLVLANESAKAGGAPQFQFAADAWVENESDDGYFPETFSIPVLGLMDDVDTTSYPTPTNNVVQIKTGTGGVKASPIHTGIRTSSTAPNMNYRVVDLPIHDVYYHTNTLVAWVDSNGNKDGVANGASGMLYSVGPDEEPDSLGPVSLPNELNIVRLGWSGGWKLPNGMTTTMGINDCYTTCSPSAKALDPKQVTEISDLGFGGDGGFLKFVFDAKPLPTPAAGTTLANGSYSSMIMFNVPGTFPLVPNGAAKSSVEVDQDSPNMAIDTGFFEAQ